MGTPWGTPWAPHGPPGAPGGPGGGRGGVHAAVYMAPPPRDYARRYFLLGICTLHTKCAYSIVHSNILLDPI